MIKLKKNIIFNKDNDYYVLIPFNNKFKTIGYYDSVDGDIFVTGETQTITLANPSKQLPNEPSLTQNNNYLLTGSTTNRLSEIKTYNRNEPYKVGINGVTLYVKDEYVEYVLDGISYRTIFDNNLTTTYYFGVNGLNNLNSENYNLFKDDKKQFDDPFIEKNEINIDRINIPVFQQMLKLGNIDSIDDFNLFF